ncbi:MAG: response regulator [Bacteroidota bacterium]|nr:response regulator [Bacteroidota bacterium]
MKEKILAVDDEAVIRKLLENFLKKKYDVTTMSNGKNALDWIQNGNIPDMIICDVNMPEMDGEEFVKNVRAGELFKYIPFLMLSGDEESKTRIKFFKLGVKNFITKPFNPEELNVLIELILKNE